ncbi:MAG: DUF4167 domain-containing protein [Hyphomicrobiaceae bacterium]
MRQGQQNRRGRGRNRKGQHHHNPLMRTYQSNGPDQKIHGTPAQIAEKYISLARDALSSGDPVLAENYLQHAEHYNRIILTYREQQMQQGGDGMNGGPARLRPEGFDVGDDMDDEGDDAQPDIGGQPVRIDQQSRGSEPQPRGFDQPQPRGDERASRQHEGFRENGHRDSNRQYRQRGFGQGRGDRQERRGGDRVMRSGRDRQESAEQIGVADRERPADRAALENGADAPELQQAAPPRRRERFSDEQHEQPEFLRRPVRRPRKEAAADPAAESEASVDDASAKG